MKVELRDDPVELFASIIKFSARYEHHDDNNVLSEGRPSIKSCNLAQSRQGFGDLIQVVKVAEKVVADCLPLSNRKASLLTLEKISRS